MEVLVRDGVKFLDQNAESDRHASNVGKERNNETALCVLLGKSSLDSSEERKSFSLVGNILNI